MADERCGDLVQTTYGKYFIHKGYFLSPRAALGGVLRGRGENTDTERCNVILDEQFFGSLQYCSIHARQT